MNAEPQPSAPSDSLVRLAAQARTNPYFFGSVLAAYQRRHQLDDAGLAVRLGCDVAVLTHLRLCRRPGTATGWTAAEDVAVIARALPHRPGHPAQVVEATAQ